MEDVSEEVPDMSKDLQVLTQKASIPTNEVETHSEENIPSDLVSEYEEIPSTRELAKELVVIHELVKES